MAHVPNIRLHAIRAHEGSQAWAWEELTFQLIFDPMIRRCSRCVGSGQVAPAPIDCGEIGVGAIRVDGEPVAEFERAPDQR